MNPAFSKTEAMLNGYEEAIVLTHEGKVSEGSAENLFMVRQGPARHARRGLGHPRGHHACRASSSSRERGARHRDARPRPIDRSELYVADEVFLCGTGAQVSPVASIDHRQVGNGGIGPITQRIMTAYFDAVRGRSPAYSDWVTPVY